LRRSSGCSIELVGEFAEGLGKALRDPAFAAHNGCATLRGCGFGLSDSRLAIGAAPKRTNSAVADCLGVNVISGLRLWRRGANLPELSI
jgi:hypothetical protein